MKLALKKLKERKIALGHRAVVYMARWRGKFASSSGGTKGGRRGGHSFSLFSFGLKGSQMFVSLSHCVPLVCRKTSHGQEGSGTGER